MKLLLLFWVLFSVTANAEVCRMTYQADIAASTTPVKYRSETKDRKCLYIQNQSASVVYIKFDSAQSGTENLQLAGGATYQPIVIPVNAFYMRSAAGIATVTIIEGK